MATEALLSTSPQSRAKSILLHNPYHIGVPKDREESKWLIISRLVVPRSVGRIQNGSINRAVLGSTKCTLLFQVWPGIPVGLNKKSSWGVSDCNTPLPPPPKYYVS